MKKLCCLLWLTTLPMSLFAQTPASAKPQPVRFSLPVAASGRVTYLDTAHAPGVSAKRLLDAAYDIFAHNLIYFDYPLTPADTLGMPRPHEPAAAGENVFIGSVLLFDPQSPPPAYVPCVSPPLDPNASYPKLHYAVFTLRLRAQDGACAITLTDLRLRSLPFDYSMKRLMARYKPQPSQATTPFLTHRLPGQTVEVVYARWLPTVGNGQAKTGTAKPAQPVTATEAEARRLNETMRGITYMLRRQMQTLSPDRP